MKKQYLFTAVLALAVVFASCCRSGETVSGKVTADGKGIAGVVVTDGLHVTATDAQGSYKLPSRADSRFVYITTPAGYESPVEEGVVKFYLPVEEGRTDYSFTLAPKAQDDTRHGFIVVADPQIWHRKEFAMLAEAAQDIRATVESYGQMPFHGVCAGDIIASDHSFYPEYNSVMQKTGIAFRNCMGNHDMTNFGRSHETSQTDYEKMYGPAYYSYNVGEVHYVVLNDNFFLGRDWYYIGYLDERQLAWLEKDLSYVPEGSTVIVCLHIPTTEDESDRASFQMSGAASTMTNHRGLYEILEPYNVHIVSGHAHTTSNQIVTPTLREHNTAALSGAWWQGALCTDGTPCGYGVYEVDGADVKWHYRSTGYPADHQMRIYTGSDYPQFKGLVAANVWNADPEWTVELWADGSRVAEMERFEGIDPDAAEMYSADKELDHKWIGPTRTKHLFKAPLPAGKSGLEVMARDNFGNEYRAAVRP